MEMIFTLLVLTTLVVVPCSAVTTKRPKSHRLSELTAEDRAMEQKLCDRNTSLETRQRVYACMVVNFPPKVLLAVQACTKEATPDIEDKELVARKLCDDKLAKRTMTNCLRAKSFFLIKDLDSKDIESMTTKYRKCAKTALDDDGQDVTTMVTMVDEMTTV